MEGIQTQKTNRVTITDFCNLIDMALQSKIPWKSLASFLMDITKNLENSRQATLVLLEKLEALHLKLLKKEKLHEMDLTRLANESEKQNTSGNISFHNKEYSNIADEPHDQDFLPENETIDDDDIEFLEVIEERIDKDTYSHVGQDENGENGLSLGIEEMNHSVKEIDNEWYTFITNDKTWDRETEISDEPKEIEGIKGRESKLPITSKSPDLRPKANSFQCTICLKSFSAAKYLKMHERIHNGAMPYECNTCKKRFKVKSNLNTHLKIHTGEVPFECKTCRKRFTQSGSLKIHERIHTGEKPFECKTCLKTFTQSSHLKIHERIHSGEVPFQCRTCEKRYQSLSQLRHHEKSHHKHIKT